MTVIRTTQQRELTKDLRLDRYLSSKDYERKRSLFHATLDNYLPFVCDLHGQPDGVALAEMLACVLERDGTFFGAIRKRRRRSALLDTREGWEQVTRTVAALITEKYLRDRLSDETIDELMLTVDELRARVQAAFLEMPNHAQALREAGSQVAWAENFTPATAIRPRINEGAMTRLFNMLARDIALITPPDQDGDIPETERDREVAKRALVRLRITQLRQLADENDIEEIGTIEQLADRLAASAADDAAAVAEMVINQELPAHEHGLTTTLVALKENPELPRLAERLKRLQGNFARVGVARWFICSEVTSSTTEVVARGKLKYYRVNPKLEYERYDLASDPGEADAIIVTRFGRRWLEVSTRLRGDTSALSILASRVASFGLDRPLPLALHLADPNELHQWARRSVVMLGLLAQDLSHDGIELTNVAVAQFETTGDDSIGTNTPAVRNVRVGGQHLISHRQICELLVAGRAFSQVTGSVRVTLSSQEIVVVPFRAELSADDATVFTGFTQTTNESQTSEVHRRLIDCVQTAVQRTDLPSAASDWVAAIAERARSDSPLEADILPPPP